MIVTIKEGYNKHEGIDLPMFSRSGKSTINQYLAFNSHQRKKSVFVEQQVQEDQDEDDDELKADGKPKNIAMEMQKIADLEKARIQKEKQKKRNFGAGAIFATNGKKDTVVPSKPIDFLQDTEFRRNVTCSFKTTTRDQWAASHESKTQPPEVGKYMPRYNQLFPDKKSVVILSEHQHVGQKRLCDKDFQQTHVCLKQIKALNYPVKDTRSQAKQLAQINKKILKMEEDAARIEQDARDGIIHKEKEEENSNSKANFEDDQNLDMLNFYVKELRQPNYKEVEKKPGSPPKPCQNYKMSYLPNGQQIEIKDFKDQLKAVSKLHIEDWKRQTFAYNTAFEGEVYHLVKKKADAGFVVEQNFVGSIKPDPKIQSRRKTTFSTAQPHQDNLNKLNDSRFININKSPSVSTSVHHVPVTSFGKQLQRGELFKMADSGGSFYDFKKEITMARLDAGIPNLRKVQSRTLNTSFKWSELSSINPEKAIETSTKTLKPKNPTLCNFRKQQPRDDLMLKTDDRFANLKLDYTREEREKEIKSRSTRNRQLALFSNRI